jgi:cytochrome P450 family 4
MYQHEQRALKIIHGFTDGVIKARRQELIEIRGDNSGSDLTNSIEGTKPKMALLDLLLKSSVNGKPLSDMDIREETNTFMFAGHDTTTSAISFTLYNLAKYPEIQEKVYEEVTQVFNDNNSKTTMQKLSDLHYLELVIKESMRLFPPTPHFSRKLKHELTAGGFTFPKNSNVFMSMFMMGRNALVFPKPLEFNPHRFDIETTADKTNPYSYIPFSAGPRNCVGQKMAMLELKSIISKIIENFQLSITKENENLTLVAEMILRSTNGVVLDVRKR